MPIIRVCEYCGKEYQTFESIRKKYCSQACCGLANRNGTVVQCAQCGKDFYRHLSKPNKTYCSRSCATTARNLTAANPSYSRDISGENNPMYSKGFKGTDNPMYGKRKHLAPRWKGGRKVRKDGYTLVVAPDDHPYPADIHAPSGLKYILEHRYVMEQHIGRYLRPEEVVHHKDKNPRNNDINNLELFANQSEHMLIGHS